MQYTVGQRVKIKAVLWKKKNPPTGTIVSTFELNTNKFCTEQQMMVAIRDCHLTDHGYVVHWDNTDATNPWSEIELEAA
jgi:hypothetical protein